MPVFNVYLENDAPNHVIKNPEARRKTWNQEKLIIESNETDISALSDDICKFVETYIKPETLEQDTGEPLPELMFTVHKRLLSVILEQADCAGVRIFLGSRPSTANGKRPATNITIKPVNTLLEELDIVSPDKNVLISDRLTQCPPNTGCPKTSFVGFATLARIE